MYAKMYKKNLFAKDCAHCDQENVFENTQCTFFKCVYCGNVITSNGFRNYRDWGKGLTSHEIIADIESALERGDYM